ncbi:MAG TPA: AMP-binding protein, partial [Woeseiaceae bacterium]
MMSANPAQPPGTAEYQRIEQLVLPDTVAELVEQAAQRFGQRQALSFFEDGISLSYAELATRVRKLAHGLSLAGVRHGAHVAVLLSNRVEFPLTWLALARLGAVMVPVITSSTAHELGFILKDADVSFLIVEQQFAQVLNDLPARPSREQVIVVGSSAGSDMRDFSDLMESGDAKFVPTHPPARNDLLNIQYTSGTTGMPKGAMQSHRFWIVAGTVIPNMWRNEMRVVLS